MLEQAYGITHKQTKMNTTKEIHENEIVHYVFFRSVFTPFAPYGNFQLSKKAYRALFFFGKGGLQKMEIEH